MPWHLAQRSDVHLKDQTRTKTYWSRPDPSRPMRNGQASKWRRESEGWFPLRNSGTGCIEYVLEDAVIAFHLSEARRCWSKEGRSVMPCDYPACSPNESAPTRTNTR